MLVSRPPDKRIASAAFRCTADSRATLRSRIIWEAGISDCVLVVKTNVSGRKFYIS
jgi:hypothetical protein